MKPIQPVLLVFAFFLLLLYLRCFRNRLISRLLIVFAGALAIVFILMPDSTQMLAHLVGVGRGVDLLFYLGFSITAFLAIMLFGKNQELSSRLTLLTRRMAIETAELRRELESFRTGSAQMAGNSSEHNHTETGSHNPPSAPPA